MHSNEILGNTKPTWTLSEDKLTYTKIYNALINEDYATPVQDIYGNESWIKIRIKTKEYCYNNNGFDFKDNQFVLARNMIISSDFKYVVVGFLCEYNDIKNFINTNIESNDDNNKKDNDYFNLDIDNNNNNIENKKEKSMESLKYSPIENTKSNEKSFIYNYSPNDKNENESGLEENMNQISCGNYFILYNFYIYRNKNG